MTRLIVAIVLLVVAAPAVWAQRTVMLEWDASDDGIPIVGYIVQVGDVPSTTIDWVDVGFVTTTTIMLNTGIWYVRVLAYNLEGHSPPSDEISVTIEDPVPVNCVMSPWTFNRAGDWLIPCQLTTKTTDPPDAARLTRAEVWLRTIITPASNGGTPCGATTQKRTGTQVCVYVPPLEECVTTPLTIVMATWTLPFVYTASEPIDTVVPLRNANGQISHAAFTDMRGCMLTKSRW